MHSKEGTYEGTEVAHVYCTIRGCTQKLAVQSPYSQRNHFYGFLMTTDEWDNFRSTNKICNVQESEWTMTVITNHYMIFAADLCNLF